MAQIPDEIRGSINSEFARRIEESMSNPFDVVIEVEPSNSELVANQLAGIPGAALESTAIIGPSFISASLTEEALAQVAQLDSVVLVHQDQLTGVRNFSAPVRDFPFLTAENDPIREALSEQIFAWAGEQDPYLGRVGISPIEQPRFNFAQLPPGDIPQIATSGVQALSGANLTGEEYIPTGRSVEWILDGEATIGANGADSKVSVIDTGHTPLEPANGGRLPYAESMVPGEPPADMNGHGSWCTNTVAGGPAPSTWGEVSGVADGAQHAHFKALNTLPGFGKTSWILRAMNRALEWGSDVISMSLGGAQQGPLDEDPYARFIRRNCKENAGDENGAIFVVAAGNSGPGTFEVGSPGVAEKALTVASWSLKDESPSYFSSRGPQGTWYGSNTDRFEQDRGNYSTSEYIKPDVAAPGGGRETQAKNDEEAELLHQTSVGWSEGVFDGLKDGRGLMKGTSMACPHVAGLVTRLYDADIIETAAEVKQVVAERGEVPPFPQAAENSETAVNGKNIAVGFGPIRESLFDV